MSESNQAKEVQVWDLFIRFFHWSLALLFVGAYLTGGEDLPGFLVDLLGMGDEPPLHQWMGYGIVALLIARVVWGFIGSPHARFSDFIYDRATVVEYARGLMRGDARRYIGHNPLGGLAVIVLMTSLALTTLTGMLHYGIDDGKGPFGALKEAELTLDIEKLSPVSSARAHSEEHDEDDEEGEEGEEYLEEVHEFFANFTLLLVFIHLGGVFVESVFHRENLARAMVTGKKRAD